MENCCHICGDIGVKEALLTCSQCKSTEHMYCMRTLLEEHVDDWLCEDCESRSKQMSLASSLTKEFPSMSKFTNSWEVHRGAVLLAENRKLLKESRKGSIDWEKKVATRRTKYICAKEAITLSSGIMKSLPRSKVTSRPTPPQPKIRVNKSERPLMRTQLSTKQDLDLQPSHQLKMHRLGNVVISVGLEQQPKKLTGGNECTPVEPRTCDAENEKNLVSDSEKCSCIPALGASWKGSFSIHDGLKRVEVNLQIQAHSPSPVRGKAYEFSKQMPEVLDFELVSCEKFWIYFFQDYFPDRRDIGLYFFASDRNRSESYVSLLESISERNLALRKQIGDVELLVFTSKLLPPDCQRWAGKHFLWGVFHHLKQNPTACSDNRGPSKDANYDHNQGTGSQEVVMEIDINAERMDVSVQNETVKEEDMSFRDESGSAKQISVAGYTGSVTRVSSVNVKMEPRYDIPPGFEEMFRLRVQDSGSSAKKSELFEGKNKRPECV